MDEKFTVYLETTIPSYLTGRPSSDIIVAGKQLLTLDWWETRRERYRLVVSPAVLDEASKGDPTAASRRMELLEGIEVLKSDEAMFEIMDRILETNLIPKKAATDAAHIAYAARHGVDFLMTWNCTHLANAEIQLQIRKIVTACGFDMPRICTPDELSGNPPYEF